MRSLTSQLKRMKEEEIFFMDYLQLPRNVRLDIEIETLNGFETAYQIKRSVKIGKFTNIYIKPVFVEVER